jgi:hypothetical protein
MSVRTGIFFGVHLLLLVLSFSIFNRWGSDLNNYYVDLIGGDETYWVNASDCHVDYDFAVCYSYFRSSYPFFIHSFKGATESLFIFALVKALAYLWAARCFVEGASRVGASSPLVMSAFLYLNPYVIALHSTALRDDIIVTFVLYFIGYFLFKPISTKTMLISVALIAAMMGLRFGFGVIMLGFFLSRMGFLVLESKAKVVRITFGTVGLLTVLTGVGYVVSYFGYELEFSPIAVLEGFRKLVLSPSPHNVLSGRILELGTDVAVVRWYALIFPAFSAFIVVVSTMLLLHPKESLLKKNLGRLGWVAALGFMLLVPYVLSPLEVAGPRQSLPATILLFVVFACPTISMLVEFVAGGRRGSLSKRPCNDL